MLKFKLLRISPLKSNQSSKHCILRTLSSILIPPLYLCIHTLSMDWTGGISFSSTTCETLCRNSHHMNSWLTVQKAHIIFSLDRWVVHHTRWPITNGEGNSAESTKAKQKSAVALSQSSALCRKASAWISESWRRLERKSIFRKHFMSAHSGKP